MSSESCVRVVSVLQKVVCDRERVRTGGRGDEMRCAGVRAFSSGVSEKT